MKLFFSKDFLKIKFDTQNEIEFLTFKNMLYQQSLECDLSEGIITLPLDKILNWVYWGPIRLMHKNGGWERVTLSKPNSKTLSLVYHFRWYIPVLFSLLVVFVLAILAKLMLNAVFTEGHYVGFSYLFLGLFITFFLLSLIYLLLAHRKILGALNESSN